MSKVLLTGEEYQLLKEDVFTEIEILREIYELMHELIQQGGLKPEAKAHIMAFQALDAKLSECYKARAGYST